MQAKALEIRDRATFLPVLAVDMNPACFADEGIVFEAQHFLLRRCGYPCRGEPNVLITRLSGDGKASNDPYFWGDRTMKTAHDFIIRNWSTLRDGDVVDVEFILGEVEQPKVSERLEA